MEIVGDALMAAPMYQAARLYAGQAYCNRVHLDGVCKLTNLFNWNFHPLEAVSR